MPPLKKSRGAFPYLSPWLRRHCPSPTMAKMHTNLNSFCSLWRAPTGDIRSVSQFGRGHRRTPRDRLGLCVDYLRSNGKHCQSTLRVFPTSCPTRARRLLRFRRGSQCTYGTSDNLYRLKEASIIVDLLHIVGGFHSVKGDC